MHRAIFRQAPILLLLLLLVPDPTAAQTSLAAFKQEPCYEVGLPQMPGLPDDMPIGILSGHPFRKKDGCVPFDLVLTWSERYEEGLDWYEVSYRQHVPGALWYRKDKKDFVINANEVMYKGYADVQGFTGRGKQCTDEDGGRCKKWETYTGAQIRPRSNPMGGYQGIFFYGPATEITDPQFDTDERDIPKQLSTRSVSRSFTGAEGSRWQPDTPDLENPALADFDYKEFVLAAVEKRPLTKRITWDNNDDLESGPSSTKGSLKLQFIFDPPCPEKLVVRADRKNYLFSEDSPGVVVIEAEVIDTKNFPTPYLENVEWDVPRPAGTTVKVEHPGGRQYKARITYTGLPKRNADLGVQDIKASVFLGSKCGRLEGKPGVRLFFPRDAKNNPKAAAPNWYYYWQQTAAGHGTKAEVDIRYGAADYRCSQNKWWMGVFPLDRKNLGTPSKPIHALAGRAYVFLCDFVKAKGIFPKDGQGRPNDDFYLESRLPFNNDSWSGIDTFGVVCLHELNHRKHWHEWWNDGGSHPHGLYPEEGYYDRNKNGERDTDEPMLDSDKDHIPDGKEPGFAGDPYYMEFKVTPGQPKSYNVAGDDMTDEHVLTYTASEDPGIGWKHGAADKEDWAKPGKQWKEE